MAKTQFLCPYDGMPAITLIKGTAVCNNQACQATAGLTASPADPQGEQTPHGPGIPKRVPGPNEVPTGNVKKISQGILRKGATGIEVSNVDDPNDVLHIVHSDQIIDVIDFVRNNFPNEWCELLRTVNLRALESDPPERT